MAQQLMQFADELKPVLIDDLGLSDDEDDFPAVNASFDKFNESFEKDNEFWKNAYETLDDDEYDKFVEESLMKSKNDFNKFNESFEKQNEFWRNASISMDEDNFEKLVEEECLEEPFVEVPEMDIDFEPYLNLFKKGDMFWNLATKNLKDEEYEKLVQIYIASEKITWNNLTSDVFLAKPSLKLKVENSEIIQKPVIASDKPEETKDADDVKPFLCDLCQKAFKLSNQLKIHKEFNHAQDRPLTCNFCHRVFKQFDALQKHRQMHTE